MGIGSSKYFRMGPPNSAATGTNRRTERIGEHRPVYEVSPRRRMGPVEVVLRLAGATAAISILILSLFTIDSVAEGRGGLYERAIDQLNPPLVRPIDTTSFLKVFEAVGAAPAQSIDVDISIALTDRSDEAAGFGSIAATIQLTAAPSNPLVALLRPGIDDIYAGDAVASIAGGQVSVATSYVNFERPILSVGNSAGNKVIITVVGKGTVPLGRKRVVLPKTNLCPVSIGQRVVRVESPDLRVTGVQLNTDNGTSDCASGGWAAQGRQSATYRGTKGASIDLSPESATLSAQINRHPLIGLSAETWSAVGYSVLAAVPLALAWWRLRRPNYGAPGVRTPGAP